MSLHTLHCLGCKALTIGIGIGTYFAYKYMNRNRETGAKEIINYEAMLPY